MSGLEGELAALRHAMTNVYAVATMQRQIYVGELAGQKIVLASSGVGKVRASAFAQHLIDSFDVDEMIIFGLAGALDSTLKIGDIVVSKTAAIHDYRVAGLGVAEDIRIDPIHANSGLVDLAVRAGRNVAPGEVVRVGTVLTGDSAIADSQTRAALRRDFAGDCVEMEGAAAALVCSLNHVPFVIVRTISDLADEHAHAQFERTFREVSDRSARVVAEMLRLMSQPLMAGRKRGEPATPAPPGRRRSR